MNHLKRIINLLIAVVIVCNTFICYAYGKYDVATGFGIIELDVSEVMSAEADELFFAVTGKALGGNTRGAFISDVVSLMKLEPAKPDVPDFKDVLPGRGDSGYIHTALEAGLISNGDSFRPDDAITLNEAVTILVRAIGYGQLAEYKGGWPIGYIKCAKEANLLDGINEAADILSVSDAKILVLNMLNAYMIDTTYSTDSYAFEVGEKTFLQCYYDISAWNAVVSKTPSGGFDSFGDYGEKKNLVAGEKSFSIKDNKNYSHLLGYNANIYYDKNGCVVSASKDSINKSVLISGECAQSDGGLRLVCNGEKKSTIFKLDEAYSLVYNGAKTTRRLKDLLPLTEGEVELIDNDGDNTYEVVSVRESFFVTVKSVSKKEKIVYDKNTPVNNLDLSDDYGNYTIQKDNEEIWLTLLEANDTLEVYRSEDKKTIQAYVLKDTVSGSVDGISEDAVTIAGNDYTMTDYFRQYYFDTVKPGSSGSFVISSMGRLITFSDYSANLSYGYVTGVMKESALSAGVKMRIFTEDGKQEIFFLKDKVRLDGKSATAEDVYNIFGSGDSLQSQLITYSADDGNTLVAIDLAETAGADKFGEKSDPSNNLKEYIFGQKSFYYKNGAEVMYPCFNVASTTVFVIPNDLSDMDIYRVTTSSYFKDCDTYTLKVYDVDEAGCAGAVVYRTDEISPRISEYAPSFVIEEVTTAIDSEGSVRYKIYGWQEKKFVSYFLDESIGIYKKSGEKLGFGDIIRFYEENGIIKALVCDFDANKNVFARNNSSDAAEFNVGNKSVNYQSGKVFSMGTDYVFMTNADTDADDFSTENLRNFTFKTDNIAIIDITEGTVKTGKREDIKTYKNSYDSADFVLLRQRMLSTSACFVYVR